MVFEAGALSAYEEEERPHTSRSRTIPAYVAVRRIALFHGCGVSESVGALAWHHTHLDGLPSESLQIWMVFNVFKHRTI